MEHGHLLSGPALRTIRLHPLAFGQHPLCKLSHDVEKALLYPIQRTVRPMHRV